MKVTAIRLGLDAISELLDTNVVTYALRWLLFFPMESLHAELAGYTARLRTSYFKNF